MKKDNIIFSSKKNVLEIENIETEKLYEIKNQIKEKIKKLRKNINYHEKYCDFIATIAFIQSIRIIASVILHNNGFLDAIKTLAIAEGTIISIPAIYEKIGKIILDKKMSKEYDKYSKINDEISKRSIIKAQKIEREKMEKSLNELKDEITESEELNEYKQFLKEHVIEYLLNNNANTDIINMPGIQKIFDIAILGEEDSIAKRVYNWNKPNEDGTFTISSHMKFPFGCNAYDYPKTYKISYCKDNNPEHYLEVRYKNILIYINQEGFITSLETPIHKDNGSEIISVPIKQKEKVYTI